MKRKIRLIAMCFVLLAACASGGSVGRGADPIEYFCPTTNTALVGTSEELSGFAYHPYPRTQAEANALVGEHQYVRLLITSCTNEQRLCLDIRAIQNPSVTRLVLPKRLEVGREYSFEGTRVVSTYTDLRQKAPTKAQVVLWSGTSSLGKPIKLTVESGRGIIYWEGIDFGLASESVPSVCALVTRKGLLAEVAVAPPEKSPPRPY